MVVKCVFCFLYSWQLCRISLFSKGNRNNSCDKQPHHNNDFDVVEQQTTITENKKGALHNNVIASMLFWWNEVLAHKSVYTSP